LGLIEQPADQRQLGLTVTIGEEAIMADAVEAGWQAVEQESADELVGLKGHHPDLAALAIVAPAEADAGVIDRHEAAIGDGDAVV
jgi:hypothetical protein